MQRINVVGVNTRYGYRTCALYIGDVTQLGRHVDVLGISAFAGSYEPIPGTVIRALEKNLGVNVEQLSRAPEFDLRTALGVWVSEPIADQEFSRIVCAELLNSGLTFRAVLENVFVVLSMLEAKRVPIRTTAFPLLGTGSQRLDAREVAGELIRASRRFLERSSSAEEVLFLAKDGLKAAAIAQAMDEALGRQNISLQTSQLLSAIRADVADTLRESADLFLPDAEIVREDWVRLLESTEVKASELAVQGRKLVELLVRRLHPTGKGHLRERIHALETQGQVAPWIGGYMHVLRHFGNEAAHAGGGKDRVPPFMEEADLGMCLLCVERLLRFWMQSSRAKSSASNS